jgi:aminopeptidase N
VPEKLWAAVQNRAPAIQIGRIMDPWTTQSGFPYITVNLNGTAVSVTQRRFMLKNKDHTDTTTWPIPLSYATKASDFANTAPQQIYFKEDGALKTFTLTAAPENYLIVNNQQTGYYRVNYDIDNWMKIKEALHSDDHGGIHVLNRAQIVDDLFNFARGGIVDYATTLDILEYIKNEKHYIPWLPVFNGMSYISRRLTGAEDMDLLGHHVLDILENYYNQLGFEPKADDSQTEKLARTQVLSWLCRYGHEECLQKSRDEFVKFITPPNDYL